MPFRPGTLSFDPRTGALLPAEQAIAGWDSPYQAPPMLATPEQQDDQASQPDPGAPPTAAVAAQGVQQPATAAQQPQPVDDYQDTPVGQLMAQGRLGGHPVAPDEPPPGAPAVDSPVYSPWNLATKNVPFLFDSSRLGGEATESMTPSEVSADWARQRADNLNTAPPPGITDLEKADMPVPGEVTPRYPSTPQQISYKRPLTESPPSRVTGPNGDLTPDQSALSDPDVWSLCGPVAAMAFARAQGRSPTIAEAKQLAREVGWTPGNGMAGPASQVALLSKMGVSATLSDASTDRVRTDVQSGNPVIISTPQHYFVAEKYDEKDGRFYFGTSGTILARMGGKAWMTLKEVERVGKGIQGAIYMDNPSTPDPSPTAGASPIQQAAGAAIGAGLTGLNRAQQGAEGIAGAVMGVANDPAQNGGGQAPWNGGSGGPQASMIQPPAETSESSPPPEPPPVVPPPYIPETPSGDGRGVSYVSAADYEASLFTERPIQPGGDLPPSMQAAAQAQATGAMGTSIPGAGAAAFGLGLPVAMGGLKGELGGLGKALGGRAKGPLETGGAGPRGIGPEGVPTTAKAHDAEVARLTKAAEAATPGTEEHLTALDALATAEDRRGAFLSASEQAGNNQAEIAGLKAQIAETPGGQFLNLIAKSGEFKGDIPETLAVSTFRELTGKQPMMASIKGGRVPTHIALDEAASQAGMTTDELQASIREARMAQQRIAELSQPVQPETSQPAAVLTHTSVDTASDLAERNARQQRIADLSKPSGPQFGAQPATPLDRTPAAAPQSFDDAQAALAAAVRRSDIAEQKLQRAQERLAPGEEQRQLIAEADAAEQAVTDAREAFREARRSAPAAAPQEPLSASPRPDLAPGEQERGLTERMRTTPGLVSDPFKAELDRNIQTYEELGNQVAHDRAAERIAADPEASLARVMDVQGPRDPIVTSEGIQLMRQAEAAGNDAHALDIAAAIAARTTTAGQEINLLKTMGQMSPDAVRVELARTVQKANETHGAAAVRSRMADAEVSVIQAKYDRLLKDVDAMQELSRRSIAKTVKEAVEKQAPITFSAAEQHIRTLLLDTESGALRLIRGSEAHVPPEMMQRWTDQAEAIKGMTDRAERAAAKDALLKDMEDFRKMAEHPQAVRVKARQVADQLTAKPAALPEADAAGQRVPTPAGTLRTTAESRAATAAGEAGQRAAAQQALADAKAEQAAIEKKLLDIERVPKALSAQKQRAADQAAAAEAKQQALAEAKAPVLAQKAAEQAAKKAEAAYQALARREETTRAQAVARLQRQDEAAAAADLRDQKIIADRKVAAATAEAKKYESQITYLTDPEARAVKKVLRDDAQKATNAARAAARETTLRNGLGIPPELAQNIVDRTRMAQAMEPGLQQQRLYAGIMHDIQAVVPPNKWDLFWKLHGLPKDFKILVDTAHLMHIGYRTLGSHPGIYFNAIGDVLKGMRNPENAAAILDSIATRPNANLWGMAGGKINEIRGTEFFSPLSRRVPGAQGVSRGIAVEASKLQSDLFDNAVNRWLPKGVKDYSGYANLDAAAAAVGKTPAHFTDLVHTFNAITNGNEIPFLKGRMAKLGETLFAPKWVYSQAEPFGIALHPGTTREARLEAVGSIAAYYGGIAAIEAAGAYAGIWDAEADPRSSRFMHVRFKDTNSWIDPTMGVSRILSMFAQVGTGSYKPSSAVAGGGPAFNAPGYTKPTDRTQPILNYGRSKLNVLEATAADFYTGHDARGNSRDITHPLDVAGAIYNMISPITAGDVIDAWATEGPSAIPLPSLNAAGVSVATYTSVSDLQNRAAKTMGLNNYNEADKGQRNIINADPDVQAKIAQIDGFGFTKSKAQQALSDYHTFHDEHEKPVADAIAAGVSGVNLRKIIQTMKDKNQTQATDLITPDVKASMVNDPKSARDLFASQYWNIQPKEVAGQLDYTGVDAARQSVLDQAKTAGVDTQYITAIGQGTYRGVPYKDPQVEKVMEQYTHDQDALRPYWNVKQALLDRAPQVKALDDRIQQSKQDQSLQGQALTQALQAAWNTEVEPAITGQHASMAANNPQMEQALERWYGHVNPGLKAQPGVPRAPAAPRSQTRR